MKTYSTSNELQRYISETASIFNHRNRWDIGMAMALAEEVMSDANAHAEVRLMKAAPDMLAALKLAREQLRAGYSPQFSDAECEKLCPALGVIRVAIAKAEGRAE